MTALISKIHVAKAQLGLEDDDYRAILRAVTDKDSSAAMNQAERIAVLKELERRGFRNRSAASTATGRYAPVLKALWRAAYDLGIARVKDDKALIAFVQRQTRISHTRFLTDSADAARAIEGLKAWIAREGGIAWPGRDVLAIKRAIVTAQWKRLIALGAVTLQSGAADDDGLGEYIGKAARGYKRRLSDINDPTITAEDLDAAQAALGRWIRKVLAQRKETGK